MRIWRLIAFFGFSAAMGATGVYALTGQQATTMPGTGYEDALDRGETVSPAADHELHVVSVHVAAVTGVVGFIVAGDRVDVLIIRAVEGRMKVSILLENVEVVTIRPGVDGNVTTPPGGYVANLAMTVGDAQKLAIAQQSGTLSLILRSEGDDAPGERPWRQSPVEPPMQTLFPPVFRIPTDDDLIRPRGARDAERPLGGCSGGGSGRVENPPYRTSRSNSGKALRAEGGVTVGAPDTT
jgi:hypothetical protein